MNTVNNFPDAIPEMYGFRPQQGLLIMNPYLQNPDKHYLK